METLNISELYDFAFTNILKNEAEMSLVLSRQRNLIYSSIFSENLISEQLQMVCQNVHGHSNNEMVENTMQSIKKSCLINN